MAVIWETYSAFANTLGGIILLGVEEYVDKSWHPVNLPDPEKLIKNFWDIVNNAYKISANILSDKDVTISYIIPITQNLSRVGSYQITTGSVTFHRSPTERIHVTLFSAQNYTATTSRYWAENIVYGCTFLTGRNYTQIYRNSICSWYLGNGDPSAMGNIESVSGNVTSLTKSLIFGVGNSTYGINPAGYYYGVIIVTDTAYFGQADILHENSYVECSGITTM